MMHTSLDWKNNLHQFLRVIQRKLMQVIFSFDPQQVTHNPV